jgi:DNA-binding NarL/FixJ family response regulator
LFREDIAGDTFVLHITPSERTALQLLAEGRARHQIADSLQVSEKEIDGQLTTLFARMGVANPTEAVAAAFRRGLILSEEMRPEAVWR